MRSRCYDKKHKSYNGYGGRGIKICSEWQEFINFEKWAFENGYNPSADKFKCTLDRIDNKKITSLQIVAECQ